MLEQNTPPPAFAKMTVDETGSESLDNALDSEGIRAELLQLSPTPVVVLPNSATTTQVGSLKTEPSRVTASRPQPHHSHRVNERKDRNSTLFSATNDPSDPSDSDDSSSDDNKQPQGNNPATKQLTGIKTRSFFAKDMMAKMYENIIQLDVATATSDPLLAIKFLNDMKEWAEHFQVYGKDLSFSVLHKLSSSTANASWLYSLASTTGHPNHFEGWELAIRSRCEVANMQSRKRQELDMLRMRSNQSLSAYVAHFQRLHQNTGDPDSHEIALKLTNSLTSEWITQFRTCPDWRIAYKNQKLTLALMKQIEFQLLEDAEAVKFALKQQKQNSSSAVMSATSSTFNKAKVNALDTRNPRVAVDQFPTHRIPATPGRITGYCFLCGNKDHMIYNCPQKHPPPAGLLAVKTVSAT